MPVMIGVDPHKASHTAAVLDEHGRLLDQQRISATLDGYEHLRRWAGRWPDRCWAVEGAHGIGRALAQRLVGDGEQVLDVPAKLAARVRVLSVGHGRKSDPDDAVSVAAAARNVPALRQVGVEDQATVLHLLTKRRQDLVAARTQTINRLHRLLMDLVPGGARRNLTPSAPPPCSTRLRRPERRPSPAGSWPPSSSPMCVNWSSGSPRWRRGSRSRLLSPRPAWSSCLGSVRCWRPRSWGEVGDISRFPTKHHFAAHTGTAPLEASSGQVIRHRLSRSGDRRLNHALYMMAMVQVRRPSAGQAYYRRKLAEGKSPKEALRCLKRRLSDAVYRCLLADARSPAVTG